MWWRFSLKMVRRWTQLLTKQWKRPSRLQRAVDSRKSQIYAYSPWQTSKRCFQGRVGCACEAWRRSGIRNQHAAHGSRSRRACIYSELHPSSRESCMSTTYKVLHHNLANVFAFCITGESLYQIPTADESSAIACCWEWTFWCSWRVIFKWSRSS